MSSEFWTGLSGLLVSVSGIYYAMLVYFRKAPTNPISWSAWAVIGIALFLTSGTSLGLNAITFGMINPITITVIAMWRQRSETKKPTSRELLGGALGLIAIVVWLWADRHQAPVEWTLGLSIVADFIPLLLIAEGAWKNPQEDKPLPWILFVFGFASAGLGVETFDAYHLALPIYMVLSASVVAYPLVRYRVRHRTSILEWFWVTSQPS